MLRRVSAIVQKVLARRETRFDLESKIFECEGKRKSVTDTSQNGALTKLWAQVDLVDPFAADPMVDDMQVAGLKQMGRDEVAKSEWLADLCVAEGDPGGIRSGLIAESEARVEELAATIKRIRGGR